MFPSSGSLHRRIFLALAFVTLFSIVSLGVAAYLTQRDVLAHQFIAELTATADLKKLQIMTWLAERKSDVAFLANNQFSRQQLATLLSTSVTSEEQNQAAAILRDTLMSMQRTRADYTQIIIADPSGMILVSPNEERIGTSVTLSTALLNALATVGKIPATESHIQGIEQNPISGKYEMCFGHVMYGPVPTEGASAPILGVLLVTTDMDKSIYEMLTSWRMQKTGTAVLSHAEENGTRILNQVRFDTAAPLAQVLPLEAENLAKPAQLAARGAEGRQVAVDHLGQEVITVYRYIPDVAWGLVLKMNTSEIFAPLHQLVLQVILIAVGVLIIALVVSMLIAKTLTTPIQQLVQATNAVSQGDLSVVVPTSSEDEIGILARSFSNMVANIRRHEQDLTAVNQGNAKLVQELQQWNQQLESKVEERTRALKEANIQLTMLDEMKTEFIYNISHELRNPITNLKLQLELLTKNGDSPHRGRYVDAIVRQTDLMAQLVTDMLELMQLDKMGSQIEFNPVDLNMIIADIGPKYQKLSAERSIRFAIDQPAEPLLTHGAQIQIQQAIAHLLKNAVNFTTTGQVHIHTYRQGQRAYIEIADTGTGITPTDMPYIFQRFYRGANVSQSAIPGSGLGLSLVQEVVTLHRGDLEVESQVNQGSTFRIWFPLLEPSVTHTLFVG